MSERLKKIEKNKGEKKNLKKKREEKHLNERGKEGGEVCCEQRRESTGSKRYILKNILHFFVEVFALCGCTCVCVYVCVYAWAIQVRLKKCAFLK